WKDFLQKQAGRRHDLPYGIAHQILAPSWLDHCTFCVRLLRNSEISARASHECDFFKLYFARTRKEGTALTGTILVVEDQESARESLVELLTGEGYEVHSAPDGKAGMALVDELDLVLTDLAMPGADGIAVLRHIRDVSPQTLVILMTAHATVDTAVEAIQLGAQDYLLKPLIFEDVLRKVQHLMNHRKLAWENQLLRREINTRFGSDLPLGRSAAMQEIARLIKKVAPAPTTVLITGESGVGKEVVARTIHAESRFNESVFLPVNCSAIPENLLESQLFGHVKGSFTGAVNSQEGLFQRARGGTIFLDEI